MSLWPRAVYVHVPFCLHHCGYCDFTLVASRDHLIPQYLECLSREIRHQTAGLSLPLPVDTIFIGGGTPTHLTPDQLQILLTTISQAFELSEQGEFSVEANPDGLDDARLAVLQSFRVNRLSLGVQSFDQSQLQTLERTHQPADAIEVIQRASKYFQNISVDLIFGVPGQSLSAWQQTLRTAAALPIQHISTYGLTYEQGTPFFRRENQGVLRKLPDELERDMYLEALRILQNHGLNHYEVSNFARDGFQCRHNMVYWNADEYFAFGPGAARYIHGVRSTGVRSVVRWLRSWNHHEPCLEDVERNTSEEKAREAVMLGLRLRQGFRISDLEHRFDVCLRTLAGPALDRGFRNGLIEESEGFLRLTENGLLLADTVVSDFLVGDGP
jgi:oxygen-independent coproporphyrinogen-3 oxidase